MSERPTGAEFSLPVVEPGAVPAVPVPLEPVAGLVVEPGAVSAVPEPLERFVADDEWEDEEGDSSGHGLL